MKLVRFSYDAPPPPPRKTYRLPAVRFCFLLIALLLLLASGAANAADYYISPTGNDSNPGTLAAPWKTLDRLQTAQAILRPGDTVWFRGGDYIINDSSARTSYSWTASGTAANPVIYRNYAGETPVIVADRRTGASGSHILLRNYITIDGLNFRQTDGERLAGGHGDDPNLRSDVGGPMWTALATWGTGNTIRNVSIEGFQLGMFYHGQDLLFEHNRVWDTRSHRVYISGGNGTYRYNVFGGTRGYWNQQGLQIQYAGAQGNKIYGNIIYEGQGSGVTISGKSSNNELFNNIFINSGNKSPLVVPPQGTGGFAIAVWCEREPGTSDGRMGPGNKIYNNTFMGKTKSAIFSDPLPTGCLGIRPISQIEIYNNIFNVTPGLTSGLTQPYANIHDNIMYGVTGIVPPGNTNVDPMLVNPAGNTSADAMLQAGSPAIDTAIDTPPTNPAPALDYQGGTRPVGPKKDKGAFEYGSVADPNAGGPLGGGTGGTGTPGTGGLPTSGVVIDAKDSLCNPVDAPVKLDITVTGPGDHDNGHGNDDDHNDDSNPGGGN